jgi:non-ribosomal peptide synthetase component F
VFLTKQVDVSKRSASTTLPLLLTAAWARVLSRTLATPDVTFAAIVSGRDGNVGDVDTIMGPCYQYMPIRVKFEQDWQASHLLECVRGQYLEGSARATLSFEELRRECALWPEASEGENESGCFFPSFVNHINKEFLDAVPFADSRCRIDAYAAHAERPTPPRAILFTEGSSTFLGIEADKDRQELWQKMLDDVAGAVESLVRDPEALV